MKIRRIALSASFLAILLVLACEGWVRAQVPAEPASSTPVPATAAAPASNTSTLTPSPAVVNSTLPVPPTTTPWYDSIFKQKLPIDLGFELGEAHSDNIFYQPHKTDDYITTASATLTITLGQVVPLAPQLEEETIDNDIDISHENYFHLEITPTLILFSRNSSLDDVDEHADVIYSHQFSRLTLSIEQTYDKLSQPTVQVNAQGTLINRDIYVTTARANYAYSDQLSTYGTLTQTINSYLSDQYTDNTEWIADYYFLYQLFPKLNVGVGPRIGFDDVHGLPNQKYQDLLAHAEFIATGKFEVTGAVGGEVREFEDDSEPTKVTPVVEGTATYTPFDSMTIALDGERHRTVYNGQGGSDYTASIAKLSFTQRFFQVTYFKLTASYEDDQYSGAGEGGGGTTREDDISYVAGGFEWKSFRGLTVDLGYQYLHDASNIPSFSFNESRATLSAAFTY